VLYAVLQNYDGLRARTTSADPGVEAATATGLASIDRGCLVVAASSSLRHTVGPVLAMARDAPPSASSPDELADFSARRRHVDSIEVSAQAVEADLEPAKGAHDPAQLRMPQTHDPLSTGGGTSASSVLAD
jgi:hypothetical protein